MVITWILIPASTIMYKYLAIVLYKLYIISDIYWILFYNMVITWILIPASTIMYRYLAIVLLLLLPIQVFALDNSNSDINYQDTQSYTDDISLGNNVENFQDFQPRLTPQGHSVNDHGFTFDAVKLASNHQPAAAQPRKKTGLFKENDLGKKANEKKAKKNTSNKTSAQDERRRIWYFGVGTGPFGYPFNDSTYIATGFFLSKNVALGFFGGSSSIPSPDVAKLVQGQLTSTGDLREEGILLLPPEEQAAARAALADGFAPSISENNIQINGLGLEVKLALGSLLIPFKLRRLTINSDLASTTVLSRAFTLKPEYEDTTALHDVLDNEDITLFSIGISSKFYAKWGGALEINWLTLEQAISQPKEIQQIYSIGLFGFYLGIRV